MNIGIPSSGSGEHSSQGLEYVGHVCCRLSLRVFSLGTLDFFPPGKPTVQNIHSTRPEDLQVPEHQWKLMWLPLLINIIVLFNCWQEVAMTKKLNNLCLRMVPTNYKGFCTRLWPGRKSRSLQGPLESTKKIRGGQAVFLRLGLNLN